MSRATVIEQLTRLLVQADMAAARHGDTRLRRAVDEAWRVTHGGAACCGSMMLGEQIFNCARERNHEGGHQWLVLVSEDSEDSL